VVAQTVADGETKAVGLVLVSLGYAEVYPETRPKPSKDYLDAETKARAETLEYLALLIRLT
jgi:endonuclease YncB( thermonuclease family)